MAKTAITPTREENFPEWFQEVVKASGLAEHALVRGCMVIKPWGYALWENIRDLLDRQFKETGHKNAYFPLFIPLSYFQKEADHVEGFATECAVVTHHRLEKNAEGVLEPAGPLEEPLVVRPTSEMIIGEMFSRWVESYRDLPILLNQWANVVRWEMRPRIFLRTAEFLWQEGHTAHETAEEAESESLQMLDIYVNTIKSAMAMPAIAGEKSEAERFPGAVKTFTFETMMQDCKALQAGTSHFLGQNFAKAANIQFQSREGTLEYAWTTSWGVTTRLIGSMIMMHSDDDGLILPPRIAGSHIVIIPVVHKEEMREKVESYCNALKKELESITYFNRKLTVDIDDRDERGKVWDAIKRGVPMRIEVGPREIDENKLSIAMRHKGHKDKEFLPKETLLESITERFDAMHDALYQRACKFLKENTHEITDSKAFYKFFQKGKGGFAKVYWAGDRALEEKIKQELAVTIRCIPFDQPKTSGTCPFTGKETSTQVIFAKSY